MDENNNEQMNQGPAEGTGETTPPPEIQEELQKMQQTPVEVESPAPAPAKSSSSFGPVFGIIIIVILIVLAGFYFWGASLQNQIMPAQQNEQATTTQAAEAPQQATETVSTDVGTPLSSSDDLSAIESDLNSTDLNNLDAEMNSIDSDLNVQ